MGDHISLDAGRKALQQGRFDEARSIYRGIVDEDAGQYRAWLALSALAQQEGDYRQALTCATRAAEEWRRTGQSRHLVDVSRRLLALGEYEASIALIAQTDWTSAQVVEHGAALAQLLDLAGAHERALDMATAISKAKPALDPLLMYAIARILQHLGATDEAESAYEASIAAAPLLAEAHWALANHTHAGARSGERISRIRKALAHSASDTEDAAYLWYALFKELDGLGEYENAWMALSKGLRVKRSVVRYDAERDELAHSAMQEMFTPEFSRGDRATPPPHVPIFIVGLPRSGTTLLERMIGSHRDVASAGELGDLAMQLSWETGSFISNDIAPRQVEALARIDFKTLGDAYLERTAWRARGHRYLVDKFPGNFIFSGVIGKSIPDARIIIVRRSAMDACFSLLKHVFAGGAYAYSYDLSEVASHYQHFDRLRQHWLRTMPGQVITVDYEALIMNTGPEMERIRSFCGLDADERMTQPHLNSRPSATASASQVRRPLHSEFVGQWRQYESMLTPLVQRLGQ